MEYSVPACWRRTDEIKQQLNPLIFTKTAARIAVRRKYQPQLVYLQCTGMIRRQYPAPSFVTFFHIYRLLNQC